MAAARSPKLQDAFLTHLRDHSTSLAMFLVNGVKLQGSISHFDSYSVSLTQKAQTQLVYKHAISAINPLHPVPRLEGAEDDEMPPDVEVGRVGRRNSSRSA